MCDGTSTDQFLNVESRGLDFYYISSKYLDSGCLSDIFSSAFYDVHVLELDAA